MSMTGSADADALAGGPHLPVTTRTSYGWTAQAQTAVLSC